MKRRVLRSALVIVVVIAGFLAVQRSFPPALFPYEELNTKELEKLATNGDREAQIALGMRLDGEEAVFWWTEAAENGSVSAMEVLSYWYEQGIHVAQDSTAAAEWSRRAALGGSPPAQYDFGMALLEGNGVEQNEGEAVAWLTAAAMGGDNEAFFALGELYRDGRAVERDWVEALALFTAAIYFGDVSLTYPPHANARSELSDKLSTADRDRALERADQWIRVAR